MNAPRDYRIDYVGSDGTEIHVDYVGIMQPFDIHDRDENPLAGKTGRNTTREHIDGKRLQENACAFKGT